MQRRMVGGRLRPAQGSPIWLPAGSGVDILPVEQKAYRRDEEGKALVETGLLETGKGFLFVCPICGRQERNDQRLEPACTGPSWRDEHELEPMVLVDENPVRPVSFP